MLQKCQGSDTMDEAACAAQLREAAELLTENGFAEYVPGCWAKPGCEDPFLRLEHAGCDVLGFGAGAGTKLDGAWSVNTKDLERYLRNSANYEAITAESGTCG